MVRTAIQQQIATSHPPTSSDRLVQQGHSLRKHSTVGEIEKNNSRIGRKQRSVCPTAELRLRERLSYPLRWTQDNLRRNLFGQFSGYWLRETPTSKSVSRAWRTSSHLLGQEIQRGPPGRSIFVSMRSLWSPLKNCLKLIVHR